MMQNNLELSISYSKPLLLLVLVCEYFKEYSWLCPWLFKWPDYEEEYLEDGQQDVYYN